MYFIDDFISVVKYIVFFAVNFFAIYICIKIHLIGILYYTTFFKNSLYIVYFIRCFISSFFLFISILVFNNLIYGYTCDRAVVLFPKWLMIIMIISLFVNFMCDSVLCNLKEEFTIEVAFKKLLLLLLGEIIYLFMAGWINASFSYFYSYLIVLYQKNPVITCIIMFLIMFEAFCFSRKWNIKRVFTWGSMISKM